MRAICNFLAACAAMGAMSSAAPAQAQYSSRANGVAAGQSTQISVNRCADAVQVKLGNNRDGAGALPGYAAARVLGISSVVKLGNAFAVSGVATSGRYASVADGVRRPVDLIWRCTSDRYGAVSGINITPAPRNYGAGQDSATGAYGSEDYSQYGYHRY